MSSRRHHYVPQFYLRYFLPGNSGMFWVYDKKGGPARTQTPVNTAVEAHLYCSGSPETDAHDDLERLFSRLEAVAKPILDHWQSPGVRPEESEVAEIAQFLGFMHTRVPGTAETVREVGLACSLRLLDDLKDSPEELRRLAEEVGAPSAEALRVELEAFLKTPEEHLRMKPDRPLALTVALLCTREVVEQLLNMNWCLCEAPADGFFVTSDTPLNIFAGGDVAFGTGLASPHVEVAFSISPKICLLLGRRRTQHRRRVSKAVVTKLNRRTVAAAERFIISPLKTSRLARMVAEFSSSVGMPRLDPAAVLERYGPRARYGSATSPLLQKQGRR